MRKKIVFILVAVLLVAGTACTKQETKVEPDNLKLSMSKAEVSAAVKGWTIYTNPAYRYELRFPKDWKFVDSGEDGKQAAFYPASREKEVKENKETYYGAIVLLSRSNWQEKYNLEEFYRNQLENLFLGNYEQETILIDGQEAIWFKNVRNRNQENLDALVDVIALDLDDRIIEIEIHEKQFWDQIKPIINSIHFYPSKIISDLEIQQ